MNLTSPAFDNGQEMDQKYGKKIDSVSIPLSWSDVPEGTQSFALVMVDKHPIAENHVHWMVSDISGEVTEFEEGAATQGQMPSGSREVKPYTGPVPSLWHT